MFDRGREFPHTKIKKFVQNGSTNDLLTPKMVIWVKFHRVRAKNEFHRNNAIYNL